MKAALRTRLLAGTTSGLALVLAASAVGVYVFVRVTLRAQFDRRLIETARVLASLVELDEDGIEFEYAAARQAGLMHDGDVLYEIWTADGHVVVRAPMLRGRDLPRLAVAGRATFASLTLSDGRRARCVSLHFEPRRELDSYEAWRRRGTRPWTISVARSSESLIATMRVLAAGLGLVGITSLLAALAVQAWIIRRGLAPLSSLAAQIAAIDTRDLHRRVAVEDAPAELRPVVVRLNALLGRLEASLERERTFSANVAHELRTPLAGLRTTLEVALAQPRDPETYRQYLRELLSICRQTESLVSKLLMLARLERGQIRIQPRRLSLRTALEQSWQAVAPLAAGKQITPQWSLEDPLTIETDPDLLSVVLTNLLENAVTYVNDAGQIIITARRSPDGCTLSIANTGCRLDRQLAGRVFERFWRSNQARSETGLHCGLGLALCRQIVERLGGSIEATVRPDGWFEVTLRLSTPQAATGQG